jgi:hypothetical protein
MNREQLARIAARSYPADARKERGAEVIGTLLDAGEDSPTAFALQLASVARAGLGARTRSALTQPLGQIVICALAWGAVLVLVRVLVAILSVELHGNGQVSPLAWILPTLVVVLFTAKQTRLSGILGVAFIAWDLTELQGPMPGRVFANMALPLAGFVLLAVAPRRIPTAGRGVWLVPTTLLAYLFANRVGLRPGIDIIAPLLLALCFLPFQPSFAIGWTIAWAVPSITGLLTSPGPWSVASYVLVSCLPFAVIATGLGRLRTRRD